MWQGHLIRPVPSHESPRHPPPPRPVYAPTPDELEPFLWAWLVLSRGEAQGRGHVVREPESGLRDHGS